MCLGGFNISALNNKRRLKNENIQAAADAINALGSIKIFQSVARKNAYRGGSKNIMND